MVFATVNVISSLGYKADIICMCRYTWLLLVNVISPPGYKADIICICRYTWLLLLLMLSHPQVIRQILYVYVDIRGYC